MDYSKLKKEDLIEIVNEVNDEKEMLLSKFEVEKQKLSEENKKLQKLLDEKTLLIQRITLEKENLEKDIKQALETKDNAIQNEHQVRSQLNRTQQDLQATKEENIGLKKTLDNLANLFNEIQQAYKDSTALFGTIHRNALNVQELLEYKVNLFNNPPQPKE